MPNVQASNEESKNRNCEPGAILMDPLGANGGLRGDPGRARDRRRRRSRERSCHLRTVPPMECLSLTGFGAGRNSSAILLAGCI